MQGFSLADLQKVFYRGEPCLEHLAKRSLLISSGDRYRLFSSLLGPWIVRQIAAELSEEQGYREWLAAHEGSVEGLTGKQGALREILPRIGARYRQLIITWASDPRTLPAVASLLKSVLEFVN